MDEGTRCRQRMARPADVHVRGPSRLLEARARRGKSLADVPRARRPARSLREGDGLHAHRDAAGPRAPLQRLVGVSGHWLLCADEPARHAARLQVFRGRVPPGRHRGGARLGARPFPEGRARARPLRRYRACTSTRIRARANTRTGARWSSTTAATRCATSCSRARCSGSRSITSTGCAWTPWPRCCIWTTRGTQGSGCRTASAGARISRRFSSCSS